MYKWMYDKSVELNKKETIENLTNEIIALQNIECSDRAFANECKAGMTLYNLNELFDNLEKLCSANSEVDRMSLLNEIKSHLESAKCSYSFIKNGICEMNKNDRISVEEEEINKRVSMASKPDDII